MRVGRIYLFFFVALTALVLANPASATSVTLTYKGHGGASAQGGSPYVGYPYYFSINGSTTLTPLMCDSFDNTIHLGEHWQATVTPFLQGVGMFGSTASLDYRAAGLIFKSMLAGTLSSTQAQWAVWGLFSTNAQNNQFFSKIGAGSIDAAYLTLAASAPNSAFSGLFLYTPINGTFCSNGMPQELIGYSAVPEPGTLTLIGTGLLGLASAVRRKFAKT